MEGNVIDFLMKRGFIDATTSEELRDKVRHPMKVYIGFDPTADSLHLGSLVGIVALSWFERFGHTPVVILGGATGRIGDPSGKSLERPLLADKTIESNVSSIRRHFEDLLENPVILNNNDWLSKISFVDFLRDVGKQFRLGIMLAKESVKTRLASEEGMSYTEFSYQILQSYDFYHLFKEDNVILQMGGSDQWGNITAGIEYVRKISGHSVYGATFPLVTRSDGKKFGKSEEGAIWLSPDRCSPYEFYQYLIRVADTDVIRLMKMLTFMDLIEISSIEKQMKDHPNIAQKRFAAEVTKFVHGQEGLEAALKATEGSQSELTVEVLEKIAGDMPSISLKHSDVIDQKYIDLVVRIGLLPSKGEALRLMSNGGSYLNNEKIEDPQFRLEQSHMIGSKFLLIGAGKKKKMLIILEN